MKFLSRTLKPVSNQPKDTNLEFTSDNFLSLEVSFFSFKDIIYEICFRLKSERYIDNLIVQYTA
jgi:hypothetical protein